VNTLPPQTLDAFRDHGTIRQSITENQSAVRPVLQQLASAGVSLAAVTQQLENEGLKSFNDSFDQMLAGIEEKKKALVAVRS
jgi:transaldolase